jgi:hypothetical protein
VFSQILRKEIEVMLHLCRLLAGAGLALLAMTQAPGTFAAEPLRVTTFQSDVTLPIGHWLYRQPLKTVETPLLAKGIVLEQGGKRFVLCAVDWIGAR